MEHRQKECKKHDANLRSGYHYSPYNLTVQVFKFEIKTNLIWSYIIGLELLSNKRDIYFQVIGLLSNTSKNQETLSK